MYFSLEDSIKLKFSEIPKDIKYEFLLWMEKYGKEYIEEEMAHRLKIY
jgi:hypothetical protein